MTTDPNVTADPGTGAGLIEFLDAAIEKGWINVTTAKALRSTCLKILEIDPNWETMDLRSVDMEHLFERFQNLRHNDYSDGSLRVYKGRFIQSVKMYLARLDNDANWKSYGPAPKRSARSSTGDAPKKGKPQKATSPRASAPIAAEAGPEPVVRSEAAALMRFPFPLRDDLDAVLNLPRDLTKSEAARLSAFLASLARET